MAYDAGFKAALVERVRGGEKVVDVARESGVNQNTLCCWCRRAGVSARRSGYAIERKPAAKKQQAPKSKPQAPKKEREAAKPEKELHCWRQHNGQAGEESRARAIKKKGRHLEFRVHESDGGFALCLGDTRIAGEKHLGRVLAEFPVLPDVFNAALRREQA